MLSSCYLWNEVLQQFSLQTTGNSGFLFVVLTVQSGLRSRQIYWLEILLTQLSCGSSVNYWLLKAFGATKGYWRLSTIFSCDTYFLWLEHLQYLVEITVYTGFLIGFCMLHLPNKEAFFVGKRLMMSKWQTVRMLGACGGVFGIKVRAIQNLEYYQ